MIKELSEEQLGKMHEYALEWIRIGTDCSPINKERAIAAINLAYEKGGLKPPKRILFFRSPLETIIAVNCYFLKQKGVSKEEAQKALNNGEFTYNTCCFGQHDASVAAFYEFFRHECGLVEQTEDIQGIIACVREVNWFWAYEDICFVSEKHTRCELNDQNVIHCDNAPAVEYADGMAIYAIDGVVVNEQIVMKPETITVEDIESEDNIEVRRIMIERFGIQKYLDATSAKIVDMDMIPVRTDIVDSPAMPRALIEDAKGQKHFVGTDGSTERVYYMNVESEVTTCAEAHLSISGGIPEEDIIANS